jgi:hypothetical protein
MVMTLKHPYRRLVLALTAAAALLAVTLTPAVAAHPTYDLNTLAGKVASLRGTAGLQIRFSAFVEQEAEEAEAGEAGVPAPTAPITPDFVQSSPLDGSTILAPNVKVNLDTAAAPQNETSIAVDPNDSSRIVASANDYTSRTWACDIDGTPCSALGDGYSGTYYSNDGGATWCCDNSGPNDLGTLIPGVNRLTGGQYDASGDPSVAFDSKGTVYYAGLGFNRTSAPNTVAVNRGTFDSNGHLSWSQPTFINATKSPAILNDKEWLAVDHYDGSPFQDRVYVTWTRFVFNPVNGAYTQSPIAFVYSDDGGSTFSDPKLISGNVLYGQGSRPVVAPDGTLYVFWNAAKRLDALDSTWVVKSTDGGASWSKPLAIASVADNPVLLDTAFRVNSFPAAAAAANGDLYVGWNASVPNDGSTYDGTPGCATWLAGTPAVREDCHSSAVWSKSIDGGATWSAPAPMFDQFDRNAVGYPVSQPSGGQLDAPAAAPVEDVFPAIGTASNGDVYMGAYRGLTVSPWQTCAAGPPPPEGRITCAALGDYIHNTRLDYVVRKIGGPTATVTTQHINTRYGFGGGFFGDYTDLAVGSDGTFHALYTDSNDVQDVTWFYGLEFVPTPIHQEDIATASGNW